MTTSYSTRPTVSTTYSGRPVVNTTYTARPGDYSNLYFLTDNSGSFVIDNFGDNILVGGSYYLQNTQYSVRTQP